MKMVAASVMPAVPAMATAMSATVSAAVSTAMSAAVTAFGGSNGRGKCRCGGDHAGCGKGNPSLA